MGRVLHKYSFSAFVSLDKEGADFCVCVGNIICEAERKLGTEIHNYLTLKHRNNLPLSYRNSFTLRHMNNLPMRCRE